MELTSTQIQREISRRIFEIEDRARKFPHAKGELFYLDGQITALGCLLRWVTNQKDKTEICPNCSKDCVELSDFKCVNCGFKLS